MDDTQGLTTLVLLQLLGTALNLSFLPMLPGPIIGMLLFGWLLMRGAISEPIEQAASGLLQYLPLLLVVPAAGIMTSSEVLLNGLPAVATALVLSLMVSVPLCGWLMKYMIKRAESRRDCS
ncbi:hypothetical protein YO5_09100 [Stutzerimonas stutzeri TS44]|nr:hypothetical protein YO5_09100 [Stutzerimonas stutzeri TS44]